MKINSVNSSISQSFYNSSKKSDINFKGHIFSLLPGKLKRFGKKFVDCFDMSEMVRTFPFDTYIYKKGDSLVMNTMIQGVDGKIRPIITKMQISSVDLKDNHSLSIMLNLNHEAARFNMKKDL